ncbi:IS3 family transposase [Arthrobacter sp. MYb213]|uniref:IS3 family transposase n=1 Tax=Arthrobacter sp. MYb213 TaxID=1848595 RepID=UPI000CFD35A6
MLPGHLNNRQKTLVVDALRSSYPLPMLLETIGLSTSIFYYQVKAMGRPDPYAHVRDRIHYHAKRSFFTYGYRRIWWTLRHEGLAVSEKVVRRLMHEECIEVRFAARKRRYSSYEGETTPAPENLVRRNFHAANPGELWLTDISEFSAHNGKLYLSAIIDCYDGMVVGWKTGRHPTMDLAENALKDALAF